MVFKLVYFKRLLIEMPDFFLKFIPAYIITLFVQRPKQLWLIAERPDEAGDNGYVLFKWLRENHPELKVYYAIKSNSADYPKVECLGNVIEWASWRHFRVFFLASILCGTQGGFGAPIYYVMRILGRFFSVKGKRFFLQHGITMNNLPYLSNNKIDVKVFVCGAYPEWVYFSRNFEYTNPKYLGFARYDCLENTNERKQILFMPTWRIWLDGVNENDFKKSEYYLTLSKFLTSLDLRKFVSDSGTEFIFFIHPSFKGKIQLFKEFENENIKVHSNNDVNLQSLLKSCSLLITDYSSVNFDVAYMYKPIIYYQFDEDKFRQEHYSKGYFSYLQDGFGPVFDNPPDVISCIKKLDDTNFKNPVQYVQRIERTFRLRDKNNCLRHYQELCRMDGVSTE